MPTSETRYWKLCSQDNSLHEKLLRHVETLHVPSNASKQQETAIQRREEARAKDHLMRLSKHQAVSEQEFRRLLNYKTKGITAHMVWNMMNKIRIRMLPEGAEFKTSSYRVPDQPAPGSYPYPGDRDEPETAPHLSSVSSKEEASRESSYSPPGESDGEADQIKPFIVDDVREYKNEEDAMAKL